MKTKAPKKRTIDMMSVAALNEKFDALVAEGAESYELQNVSDALDAARKRESEAEQKSATKARTSAKVNIAAAEAATIRRNAKATKAADTVDTGVFSVMLDNRPLAFVHVVPLLSVPGHERLHHERSRHAVRVLFNLVERHAHAKVTNARARALHGVPTLSESRDELITRIRWELADAIAAGIVEVE